MLLKIGMAIGAYHYIELHPDLRRFVIAWGAVACVLAVVAAWTSSLRLRASLRRASYHWLSFLLAFVAFVGGQLLVSWADFSPPESVLGNTVLDAFVVGAYSCACGLLTFSFAFQLFQLVVADSPQQKRPAETAKE